MLCAATRLADPCTAAHCGPPSLRVNQRDNIKGNGQSGLLDSADWNETEDAYSSSTLSLARAHSGSGSYAFTINGYRFLHVHWTLTDGAAWQETWDANYWNIPNARRDYFGDRQASAKAWLLLELEIAAKQGLPTLLISHSGRGPINLAKKDEEFNNALRRSTVMAIFSGHLHGLYGPQPDHDVQFSSSTSTRSRIPVFYDGSLTYEKFLSVAFKADQAGIVVTVQDSKTQAVCSSSGSKPVCPPCSSSKGPRPWTGCQRWSQESEALPRTGSDEDLWRPDPAFDVKAARCRHVGPKSSAATPCGPATGAWADSTPCADNNIGPTCSSCYNTRTYWYSKAMTACGVEPRWDDGTPCGLGTSCNACNNGYASWWYSKAFTACGIEPRWDDGAPCGLGTSCNACNNGYASWWYSKAFTACGVEKCWVVVAARCARPARRATAAAPGRAGSPARSSRGSLPACTAGGAQLLSCLILDAFRY